MAGKTIQLYGPNGKPVRSGSSNNLYASATRQNHRKQIPFLDKDHHRNITGYGRRIMMSVGRSLYANSDDCKSLVKDIVDSCTTNFIPCLAGMDKEWNKAAQNLLADHDEIADVRGHPQSNFTMRRHEIWSALIDGDGFIGLTTAKGSDFPMFQFIPGHRCYSQVDGIVDAGPYRGRKIYDGVIMDSVGRHLAYRIWDETGGEYQDISSNVLKIFYCPEYSDQIRGYSVLASSLFNIQDIHEFHQFELTAQKIAATIALIERNETGSPAPGQDITYDTIGETGTSVPPVRQYEQGQVSYFQTGTGAGYESYRHDRPSQNQSRFIEEISRKVFAAMGWNYYAVIDPTKIGGASMRVAIDKMNSARKCYQSLVLRPIERTKDIYRLAKFIQIERLEFNEDWFRVRYPGGPDLTADKKYDSQVSIERLENRLTTPSEEALRIGNMTFEQIAAGWIQDEITWNQMRDEAGLPPVPLMSGTKAASNSNTMEDNSQNKEEEEDDENQE